jgi:segregation and condensation protein B
MAEASPAWAGTNVTSLSPDHRRLHLRMMEALLFASAEPLSEAEMAARIPDNVDVRALLLELQAVYAGRGVNLRQVDGRWAFRTAEDLAFVLRREVVEQKKLSRAALETLAIVAYHQPVTRAEIEDIRGVAISKGTLDVLLEVGWIRLRGRRRTPGRPVTFGTTPAFLDHFGLGSIDDLPGLADLKAAGLLESLQPIRGELRPSGDSEELADGEDPLDPDFPGLDADLDFGREGEAERGGRPREDDLV